jgi:hypothetical protein
MLENNKKASNSQKQALRNNRIIKTTPETTQNVFSPIGEGGPDRLSPYPPQEVKKPPVQNEGKSQYEESRPKKNPLMFKFSSRPDFSEHNAPPRKNDFCFNTLPQKRR